MVVIFCLWIFSTCPHASGKERRSCMLPVRQFNLCTMGDDVTFERHNDDDDGDQKRRVHAGLRNRCVDREIDGGKCSELLEEPRQPAVLFEQLGDGGHCSRGVEAEGRHSFLGAAGRVTALLIGGAAFLLSAALLVIAYTAAYCVTVDKDFTDSTVGQYMFERSPQWGQALRGSVGLMLQMCDFVVLALCASLDWIGCSLGAVLQALYTASLDMILFIYNSFVAGLIRSPCLLHLAILAVSFAAAIRMLGTGCAFIYKRLENGVVEQKLSVHSEFEGVQLPQSRACPLLFTIQKLLGTFSLKLASERAGIPQVQGASEDRSAIGTDREIELRPPLSYPEGAGGNALPDGAEREANKEKTTETLQKMGPSTTLRGECNGRFLHFIVDLLRSILFADAMRGIMRLVHLGSSSKWRNDSNSQPKDVGVEGQPLEVELPALQPPQQDMDRISSLGQPQKETPLVGGFPTSSQRCSCTSCEDPSSSDDRAGSASERTDDGDDEWCIIAAKNHRTDSNTD